MGAGLDLRIDVVLQNANVDRAGCPDKTAGDRAGKRGDFDVVGSADIHTLAGARAGVAQHLVDISIADPRQRVGTDDTDVDGARNTDEAAAGSHRNVGDCLG